MDHAIVVEAIGKHLDTIEAYVNAIVILAVAAAWGGIRRSREIEAFGAKVDRRSAFWALAALYLVANMAILVLFLRIGDLVALLSEQDVLKGLTRLATHSWVLNPFSYFGGSGIARSHSSEGLGLLVATWWLCNASLSTLMDDKSHRASRVLLGLFVCIGLACILAINRVYSVALVALHQAAPSLYSAVLDTQSERAIGNGLGIVVGGLIFLAANRLQTVAGATGPHLHQDDT